MLPFAVVQNKPKKSNYEAIPSSATCDDDDSLISFSPYKRRHCHHSYSCSHNSATARLLGVLLLLCMAGCCAVLLFFGMIRSNNNNNNNNNAQEQQQQPHHHSETVPTLLSMVDPSTNAYIYALDNPLYSELQEAVLHDRKSSSSSGNKLWNHVKEFPELSVNVVQQDNQLWKEEGGKPFSDSTMTTSLTVSWTDGKDRHGEALLKDGRSDNDILVLKCGDDDEDLSLLEAATLPQVRATHRKTTAHSSNRKNHRSNRRKTTRSSTTTTTTTSNNHREWQWDDDDSSSSGTVSSRGSDDTSSNNEWHGSSSSSSSATNDEEWHTSDTEWRSSSNEWYIPSVPSSILRQPYCQFVMYQKIQPLEYVMVAESAMIQLGQVSKPFGIHLALTAAPDRMLVQFHTGSATGTPVVQYGTQANKMTIKVIGTTDTYTAADMCQAPANETAPGKFQSPGYLHAVELTGLAADNNNTVYYYKVGLETGQGVTWSSTYEFRTALPAGDATEHTYLVYGDQGCPEAGWAQGSAWVASMAAREISLSKNSTNTAIRSIHHVGDLSYARGAAHQWDAWLDMIEPVSARVPLMIAVGNHEYDHEAGGGGAKDPSHVETDSGFMPVWGDFGNDSGGECGVPTAKRFTMPATGNGVFWYSYDYGLVHTVVISSEHDLMTGSPQYDWLEQDLRNTDRSITPWLVVESHRPFYEGEKIWNENSVGVAMRLEMEDLLYDYNVDLVIAGHYHAYHRTCDGLYRSHCDRGGPMHLTIGTAGAHLDEADVGVFTNSWTANVILQTYGYGRISIKNESALHFEFVKAGGDSDPTTGDILDDVWITRKRR